jgi:dTDP-4-amino-4,6-dideoxygalactose transaminase
MERGNTQCLKLLRNHGHRPKYYNAVVGGNFRLDALQAAVLRVKLPYLEGWTKARQRNASTYRRLLAGLAVDLDDLGRRKGVVLPVASVDRRHIYNQFVIRSDQRDELMCHLKKQLIGTEVYYPLPLHLQACFAHLAHKVGDFPVSECAARQTLALPIYPELTENMIAAVVNALTTFYEAQPSALH